MAFTRKRILKEIGCDEMRIERIGRTLYFTYKKFYSEIPAKSLDEMSLRSLVRQGKNLITHYNAKSHLPDMNRMEAFDLIITLGLETICKLDKLGHTWRPTTAFQVGLAAYEMLNLKGVSEKLDDAYIISKDDHDDRKTFYHMFSSELL
jgi:hypothetical protein